MHILLYSINMVVHLSFGTTFMLIEPHLVYRVSELQHAARSLNDYIIILTKFGGSYLLLEHVPCISLTFLGLIFLGYILYMTHFDVHLFQACFLIVY